jgi:peptidoglycan LD-endopeptidase LytH
LSIEDSTWEPISPILLDYFMYDWQARSDAALQPKIPKFSPMNIRPHGPGLPPRGSLTLPIRTENGYKAVDLSISRFEGRQIAIWERPVLTALIAVERLAAGGAVLWGGYLELRQLYASAGLFNRPEELRDLHLGIDFWSDAGTPVYAAASGVLHSQQDNARVRDYGPTILLKHTLGEGCYHSLYGHLSRSSLALHEVGSTVAAGTLIGWLGRPEENIDWPPHLHFQLIRDLQGRVGDYPGVAARADQAYYAHNCPDPAPFLGL